MTKEQRVANAYKKVFDAKKPEARSVLAELAAFCFAHSTTYIPGDALTSAFREGQRSVYLQIKRICNIDDVEIERMLAEAKKQENA